jgi:hypothetical protein
MELRNGAKGRFDYELPAPFDSPGISSRISTNMATPPSVETKQDRAKRLRGGGQATLFQESRRDLAKRLQDEWTGDRQPPDGAPYYYNSSSNSERDDKKSKRLKNTEVVPDSQEVVPCSPGLEIDESHTSPKPNTRRVSSRLTFSPQTKIDKNKTLLVVHLLNEDIMRNKKIIEELKDQRHKLSVSINNIDHSIRTTERVVYEFEVQKERISSREGGHMHN